MKKAITALALTAITFSSFAQQDNRSTKSNIQTYTPSKLLKKGQWDIKWFNNLYTQNESTFRDRKEARETFFTSSFDIFTGIGQNSSLNVGLLFEIRSNVIGDRNPFDVFKFSGENGTARSGLTSFAPAIKFNPIKSVSNFTIQSAFHIPLFDQESKDNLFDFNNDGGNQAVFLDQDGFIFQNRFFYDHSFAGEDWQLFGELNTEYNFGEESSFAFNTLRLSPGIFLSYFPTSKFTVLGLVQHTNLISFEENGFEQNFTALGGGLKYQLTKVLNIETLYTKFVRGDDTGLGQSFNIGLRALF